MLLSCILIKFGYLKHIEIDTHCIQDAVPYSVKYPPHRINIHLQGDKKYSAILWSKYILQMLYYFKHNETGVNHWDEPQQVHCRWKE